MNEPEEHPSALHGVLHGIVGHLTAPEDLAERVESVARRRRTIWWSVACSVGEGHGFRCCKLAHSRDIDDSCSSQESAVYDVQASMIAGPNRSIFSRLRPLMFLS